MRTNNIAIFIGILAVITSCKKVNPNSQIDEGHINNNTYISKAVGWTIEIPDGWKIMSREQNETYQKKGLDAIEEIVDGDIDVSELRHLISFQKNQFNIFQSTSEPFEILYEGEWEDNNAELKKLIYNTYKSQGIQSDSTATELVKIDGKKFHSYGFTIYNEAGKVILNQIHYSRLINGLDFGVTINYDNESYKNAMLNTWLNSKFK